MSHLKKIEFHLGKVGQVLEVPPFYVDFQKRSFSSAMERRNLPREGIAIYVYVTRQRHVEKLLALKRLHPDIDIPEEQKELVSAIDKLSQREFEGFIRFLGIEEFVRSVREVEEGWEYSGRGTWLKNMNPFTIYMVLIVGNARWTVRPAISREGIKGYGFEIPVDTTQREAFMNELEECELEEIHDHTENQHFHLTVDSLERCISLARTWDYYFSTNARWRQTVSLATDISEMDLSEP